MKISDEYIMREIAGDYIIVPTGQAAFNFQGLITVNELGAFIWRLLQEKDICFEEIIKAIKVVYDVDDEVVRIDTIEFLNQLIKHKMIIDNNSIKEELIDEKKI